MTLEQKLTDLIAALDALTAAMNNGQKPARPATVTTETVTAEDLQTLCTQIVREDRTKKTGIVAILAEYNAKLISDIDDKSYPAIKVKLDALI